MSDNYGVEDFEKIDSVQADQDGNITSTSVTGDGEMAEEDRYTSEENNDDNLLGDYAETVPVGEAINNSMGSGEPLISFDSPVPEEQEQFEPEPSKPEPVQTVTPTAADGSGCWGKNVDPRDVSNMSEGAEAQKGAEMSPDISPESITKVETLKQYDHVYESELSSGSVISSSDNEYSSSAEDSDSENSESPSSGEFNLDMAEPEKMETELAEEPGAASTEEKINEKNNELTTDMDNNSDAPDSEKMMDDQMGAVGGLALDEDDQAYIASKTKVESDAYVVYPENNDITDNNDSCEADKEVFNLKVGLSDQEMDSIFDKLTKDEDVDIDTSLEASEMPSFSPDNELIMTEPRSDVPMSVSKDTSDDDKSFSSNDSSDGSEDEVVCTDSDVTDNEDENVGEWNPSPVYEHSNSLEDDRSKYLDSGNMESEVLQGYEYSDKGEAAESAVGDTELHNLRNDVKGLMAEVESLVQDNKSENVMLPSLYPVRSIDIEEPAEFSEKIEVIHDKPVEYCKSSLSDPANKIGSTSDLLHVKFFSPTNMILYDPESPVIDRVSVAMSDELNDSEEEARLKEVDDELEQQNLKDIEDSLPYADESVNFEDVKQEVEIRQTSNLEAEVVKDLREVLGDLQAKREQERKQEQNHESDNNMYGDNIESVSVENVQEMFSSLKDEDFNDVSDKDDSKNEEEIMESSVEKGPEEEKDISEKDADGEFEIQDDEEVVLRPKNRDRVEVDRHDFDSMIIHDVSEAEPQYGGYARESMVIHDIDNDSINIKDAINSAAQDLVYKEVPKIKSDQLNICEESEIELDIQEKDNSLISENPMQEVPDINEPVEGIEDNDFREELMDIGSEINDNNDKIEITNSNKEKEAILDDFEIKSVKGTKCMETQMSEKVEFQENENTSAVSAESVEIEIQENENAGDICCKSELVNERKDEVQASELSITCVEDIVQKDAQRTEKPTEIKQKAIELAQMAVKEVLELIYWRDVRKTGVVFGSMLFVLIALTFCTILSVAAYLSLAILTVTLSFRIYKNVMQAVQKTNDGHPFKNLLEMDLSLRSDVVQSAADKIAANMNNMTAELRRLFLVEDYVDSIKFGLLLWLLTYVGSWFNGMTIIILGVVVIFTLPKVYETYKGPIDQNVNMVRGQLNNIMAQVSSKIPFPKKKVKSQ
ncbi:reticulon-4-like isoform X2 [Mya arenaria]|uniref:reticulon-4-like isoform X2 n=1 Tax=Mya arenaria TaxID=6604 RepID=UPI0022E33D0D|nr:reticulon-4-like isoform X2 [Mya arenaria]